MYPSPLTDSAKVNFVVSATVKCQMCEREISSDTQSAGYLLQKIIILFLAFCFKETTFFCMYKVTPQVERSFVIFSIRLTFSFSLTKFLNKKMCYSALLSIYVLIMCFKVYMNCLSGMNNRKISLLKPTRSIIVEDGKIIREKQKR